MPILEVAATIQLRSDGAHDIEYIIPSFPGELQTYQTYQMGTSYINKLCREMYWICKRKIKLKLYTLNNLSSKKQTKRFFAGKIFQKKKAFGNTIRAKQLEARSGLTFCKEIQQKLLAGKESRVLWCSCSPSRQYLRCV